MWCYGYACPSEELYHHGILGQKWGVRRYQNYDGTYTQKGLQRYNQAKEKADEASQNLKDVKSARKNGSATKGNVRVARANRDLAQTEQMRAYKNLKNDYNADQGKELYKSGKTITGNTKTSAIREAAIIAGANVAGSLLMSSGHTILGARTAEYIVAGGTAVNAMLAAKTNSENKKLRAYYAH